MNMSCHVVFGLKGELYQVEAVFTDRVSTDHAWNKPDDDNLLLYRVVLNRTQKLHLRSEGKSGDKIRYPRFTG